MTDITSSGTPEGRLGAMTSAKTPESSGSGEAANQVDIVSCVELFYFAYRDFTCEPDTILEQYGFGRAHHRVLHFVHRNPGLRVAQLLEILKITKQSLARVLKQVVNEGFVIQRAGDEDRRERRLYVSAKGARLAEKLTQIQVIRLEAALAKAGPGADKLARQFLFAMISDKDRPQVEALLKVTNGNALQTTTGANE
jgi:DNA-binding MarR family transcriptional regulator